MNNKGDKRTDFLVKFVMCGGMGALGLAAIYGGLSDYQSGRGFDAAATLVLGVGIGALLLWGAWKGAGD